MKQSEPSAVGEEENDPARSEDSSSFILHPLLPPPRSPARSWGRRNRRAREQLPRLSCRSLQRQVQDDRGALSICALGGHGAAVELDDVLDDRQAQAGAAQFAASRFVGAIET